MRVWVRSSSKITARALIELLREFAVDAESTYDSTCTHALWDLSDIDPPYPLPLDLPTLALLPAHASGACGELLQLGYRACISSGADPAALQRFLEATWRGTG